MDVKSKDDDEVAKIAAAIGEPARARMLFCLMDHHARTGTELAVAGGVSPSTASIHLNLLKEKRLIEVEVQGRHRYFRLYNLEVARVLEALAGLAGTPPKEFSGTTPRRLRFARTCYDHMGGTLAVAVSERLMWLGWVSAAYDLTPEGVAALTEIGLDLPAARSQRRRFLHPCLDWSERRPHLAGAIGAELLKLFLKREWVARNLRGRALELTDLGRRQLILDLSLEI